MPYGEDVYIRFTSSGTSYGPLAVNSVMVNRQYILTKVSFHRNTHKARQYYTDGLMKVHPEAQGT